MLLKNKRILYIEDDDRNRRLVEMVLASEGAQVWFEKWGLPAMTLSAVINHMPLDVILLDLMFRHGFSGYDIFEALRHQPELSGVPVVIVSAADPSIEMPKARDLGIPNYIAKPIDATVFPRQIHNIIEGQSVWHAQ